MRSLARWMRAVGAAMALVSLSVALRGIRRGLRRPKGRTTGRASEMLRAPVYAWMTGAYLGTALLLWHPIPVRLPGWARWAAFVLGALLYFSGLGLYLWAHRALGAMYDVSSSFGAQLYADHRLVTGGPYALSRHPMYVGVSHAALGALLLYRTWTPVLVLATVPGMALRSRQEERALAAEFGAAWEAYARRVPAWLPWPRLAAS